MRTLKTFTLRFTLALLPIILAGAGQANAAEAAAPAAKTLDTPRDFPALTSRGDWQERAREIREQILVDCGLWPMPEKTPLEAHVFDTVARDGYSVEKVYFKTLPGFYLAGNLYRPIGKGTGPFPAILNPHGHWENGRMADTPTGSIAARCISFARQGMIAFSYDMVGYNDTRFADSPNSKDFSMIHRHFGTNDPANALWNVSLMGLQTWNSIRALDFLASLDDTDTNHLAITGESGGGTQTFMLGAIDDRLSALAPAVMVSHTMQGGCLCENMPGLRIKYSNVEIAAAAAPRPQIMVAATGDWTKTMPTMEGPAVASVYSLFQARDKLRYVQFDFGHNYNQTSREAVYAFFDRWLLGQSDKSEVKEAPYQKEPDEALRVWPDGRLPDDAMTEQQLIDSLKQRAQNTWLHLAPHDVSSFENYVGTFQPAWQHTLQMDWPRFTTQEQELQTSGNAGYRAAEIELSRFREPGKVLALRFLPGNSSGKPAAPTKAVVLASPEGGSSFCDAAGNPGSLVQKLLGQGRAVWVIKTYAMDPAGDQLTDFFTTYNRTRAQRRVRDLAMIALAARGSEVGGEVILCGNGAAGLWALLAAPTPGVDAVVADCDGPIATDDHVLLADDLFCPGLRNIGGFEGAAMLAAPHPVLLHNVGRGFPTAELRDTYAALKKSKSLRVEPGQLDENALAGWISALK